MHKNVLVTGGAGFIGSHITRELVEMGHRVVVLDDLSGGQRDQVDSRAEFVQASILDHVLLSKLFTQYQFRYVYHLAAYAAEGLSHFIKRFNYLNNLVGSVNLINESIKHQVECFVFTSSIAVYGDLTPPMTEEMIPKPEDPYGIAKYAVEEELRVSNKMFGLPYVIFRPHNVYGENQNLGDPYRNVVGIFMNQLIQKKPLTIFGDGQQTRAFSYIGDIAPHIARSIHVPEAKNQIINIGADQPFSVLELANAVMKAMDLREEILHLEPRNEVQHTYADHQKAYQIFGARENLTSLDEGLARMARWAKKVGVRRSKTFEDIEIFEKLPQSWLQKN